MSESVKRESKEMYYLRIAEAVAARSTCLRRRYGAIIVKNDEIIATGYNGAPRGEQNCVDCGFCQREALGVPKGERYELCVAVHAEQNAIISAARRDMIGATIYIVGLERDGSYANPAPCIMCRRVIVNAGITKCIGMVNGEAQELPLSPPRREFLERNQNETRMTKEKLAELLDGREYGSEISREEAQQAKEAGLVVVFGASDDLIEFRGAIRGEADCYTGGIIRLTPNNFLGNHLSPLAREEEVVAELEALWCKREGCWSYRTSIPHAEFRIRDMGGDMYCVGIVFSAKDLRQTS